jgi:hypothetical protein
MNILDTEPFLEFLPEDKNGRKINIYKCNHISSTDSTYYPNVNFLDQVGNTLTPYKEKVMSLQGLGENTNRYDYPNYLSIDNSQLFFFIYNTDNYYHFVYDTLPYLISYFELKKSIPNLKLLMNYPNPQKKEFYKFVKEFLEILSITENDIKIISKNTLYIQVYFSNSYTHDIDSNLPPREEIYEFYSNIVDKAKEIGTNKQLPDKVYISRRTWIHGDMSNIGTNYTTRRRLESEDSLVKSLENIGFVEVFAENLSTIEKILLFNGAKCVVGSIGGGLCNVLFSRPECLLISICSPVFLNVNARFLYSFSKVNTKYFKETFHTEQGYWKKWMRVKSNDIVGEIENVNGDLLTILYLDENLAGWNSEMEYKKIDIKSNECLALDVGLNSSWDLDVNRFIEYVKE